jgi:hypothetical protein
MVAKTDNLSKPAAAIAILASLGFAAFTSHMWEDFLITFRASLNLATGHGLVFQPGERVHSFTSPLGTLLPALFALGDGPAVELRALWWFRLTSVAALGLAIGLAAREFFLSRLTTWAAFVGCGLWAFDPKIVDFSINGMESALLILFVVLTWRALINGSGVWPLALAFAGLQWTRPDGCIFFGLLTVAWLGWGEKPAAAPGAEAGRRVIRALALGGALYLPWLVFAWLYYGSPVPHTIIAKFSTQPLLDTIVRLALYPLRLLFGHVTLHDIFMPAYFYFGGWPAGLAWLARLLGVGAALTWCWPKVKPAGRVASTAVFLGGFYLEYIPGSPWYFPGWQILACISWAYLLDALARRIARPGPGKNLRLAGVRTAGLLLVLLQCSLLAAVAWQMRQQQSLIESHHRREIGRWLQHAADPMDRVYLEPLGYIGYYSGLRMLDNPGLAAPAVVAVRRRGETSHAQIIQALKPEWLVLRPDQVSAVNTAAPQLLSGQYRLARTFDARESIHAVRLLPGRGYLDFDAVFLVYARVAVVSSHAAR